MFFHENITKVVGLGVFHPDSRSCRRPASASGREVHPERAVHEAAGERLDMQWELQELGYAGDMDHLLRKATGSEPLGRPGGPHGNAVEARPPSL